VIALVYGVPAEISEFLFLTRLSGKSPSLAQLLLASIWQALLVAI